MRFNSFNTICVAVSSNIFNDNSNANVPTLTLQKCSRSGPLIRKFEAEEPALFPNNPFFMRLVIMGTLSSC